MRTALASFPRSGNTWLRYLIELATGAQSGSMYDDRILPRGREGLVIKTHLCNRHEFGRAIHLLRNPFDAIESYFHWKRDIQGDSAVQWERHVRDSAVEWREHTLHWSGFTLSPFEGGSRGVGAAAEQDESAGCASTLSHSPSSPMPQGRGDVLLRVRYEDLRAAPERELRRVLDWLGGDVADAACARAVEQAELERMRELSPTLGARFFRKGAVGEGQQAFSPELAAMVTNILGDLLQRFGYDRPGPAPHAMHSSPERREKE